MSKANMIKLFKSLQYRHDLFTVFADFLEMAAISVSNACDKAYYESREKKYLSIVKKYDAKEIQVFPKILAELVDALENEPSDILGDVYMQLELGNSWRGQFFIPISICNIMGELTLEGYTDIIDKQGYLTLNEPACGGGAIIIGLANALKKRGYNYQRCMKVVAQDLDIKSVHMCYLQLSLLGIDAVVMQGDTLACKFNDNVWRTPAHMMGWVVERKQFSHGQLKLNFDQAS